MRKSLMITSLIFLIVISGIGSASAVILNYPLNDFSFIHHDSSIHHDKNFNLINKIFNLTQSKGERSDFSLEKEVQNSKPNDVIAVPSSNKNINNVIEIKHNLTIYGDSKSPVKLKTSSNKGIFKISPGVKLNLINLELDNLNINYDSGIIKNSGNLVLNDSVFNNNHVVEGEGYIIYNLENANSTIFNCSFNNNAMNLGNVVYNKLSDNVNILNSIFKNNWGNGFGTAINNNKSNNFLIDKSIFDSNTGDFGGAIYNILFSNKKLTISNSNFTKNSAYFKGGSIYNCDGAGFNLSKSSFTNNRAQEEGGAIYNNNCDDFTIKTSVFNNNSATRGGGVYTSSAVSNIGNSVFSNNHAGSGGAVYNADGKKYSYVYDHSFFENNGNNKINSYGGAVTLNNANYQFTQTYFGNNSASKGAAIYLGENSQLNLKDDDIFRWNKFNNSQDFSSSYGGAIFSEDGGKIDIMNSRLLNNSANYGGSIFSSGNLDISNSNFTDNKASDGGSIYASGQLTMTNSIFKNNNALIGGAIYKSKKFNGLNIYSSTFSNNNANDGGAIYNDFSKFALINNSQFNNNKANNSGGALYDTGSNFTISNSNFSNNIGKQGNTLWFKAMYIDLIDSYINNKKIDLLDTNEIYIFDRDYYKGYFHIIYT
jgi:predicted outer membrane repeat protein